MAGLLVGGMFLAGGQIIERGHPEVGHPVALGTSVALLCAMGSRFARGRQIWPAGVMTAVALGTAAYEAKKTLDWTF
ncbi:hypothetical protein H632_c17p1 [Helicosporidium sp. ATCC 50920]|nr:hypothetical protein H632_c17p1 [Helicosporidium sp. ATCC 50920]|eukprot:KDD77109.1 hypothetical protein H632_c17p1 [Helicosporidium sp. ATCC 50920]